MLIGFQRKPRTTCRCCCNDKLTAGQIAYDVIEPWAEPGLIFELDSFLKHALSTGGIFDVFYSTSNIPIKHDKT